MCGIFSVINFNGQPLDIDKVVKARDILAHRGPDGFGLYTSSLFSSNEKKTVALAHRRLSIIDLSDNAAQPMTTSNGRYTIVFNGEIYNYKDLFKYMQSCNHAVMPGLVSASDTEVLLYLYALEGSACLSRLRGMFAFVIWDDVEKKLFAARDRFGIKPLFFLKNENELIISSELKAIKFYKGNLTTSMQAIDAFLRTGSVPAPLSIYNETTNLLPGYWMETDRTGKLKVQRWWHFTDLLTNNLNSVIANEVKQSQRHKLKYDTLAKKKIRNALLDTISAHMIADVEVGAFLSGGIDSTSIVSLMRQIGHEKIKTISVVFPGHKLDESKYSRLAAKKYNTEHLEYTLTEKEVIDDFEKMLDAMNQPTIDGVNTYFVSKAAKSFGLKVVLSGVGGDELFGGYPAFKYIPRIEKLLRLKNYIPLNQSLLNVTAKFAKNRIPAKAVEFLKHPGVENSSYKLFRGLFTDAELKQLGWNEYSDADHSVNQLFNHSTADEAGMDELMNGCMTPLQRVSYLESTNYMQNQLLRDSDVFSMAHSLELRVPFVDHLLYETALPYIDDAFNSSLSKQKLIDGVTDLPEEITHREKMGFTFPFIDWIGNNKIHKRVSKIFINGSANYFNKNSIEELEKKFINGQVHWSRIWALAVLNNFL